MDLVIFLIILGVVIFFFKRFDSFIYCLGIVDIFLRIVTFIKVQLLKGEIYLFINKYIPASIPTILSNYSAGLLYTILLWLYVVGMIIFEGYVIRTFFRRR